MTGAPAPQQPEHRPLAVEALSIALHEAGIGCSTEPCEYRTEFYEGVARTMHDTDALDLLARLAASPAPAPLDVERLGFYDLLDVADAILTNYPPDTIVCSHSVKADRGALTTAAIADLIASARLQSEPT